MASPTVCQVNGTEVEFPFKPYDCQVTFMEKVIECLKDKKNGILESPTGTGKTLCLLCSSLAWLRAKKAQIQLHQQMGVDVMQTSGDDAVAGAGVGGFDENASMMLLHGQAGMWSNDYSAPKIIYASRTHSQLSQAVQELKRTCYNDVRVCVLGSREQLCIHPVVSKEENNSTKVHLCRAKVNAHSCQFKNRLDSAIEDFRRVGVMDIEDLVSNGRRRGCCPYYMSRELKADADVIFLPYNYLLDPKTRKAQGVDVSNNVIILDEAHNVERMCEDVASFDWSSAEIASAVRDLDEIAGKLQEMATDEQAAAESCLAPDRPFSSQPARAADSDGASAMEFNLRDVLALKDMLLKLEASIDAVSIDKPEGVAKPGAFIFDLFRASGLTFENKSLFVEAIDRMTQFLTVQSDSGVFSRKGAGMNKLCDVIKIVFARDVLQNVYTPLADHEKVVSAEFKVYLKEVRKETQQGSRNKGWNSEPTSAGSKPVRVLSYWCFSAGRAMQELKQLGARCIVLTSGTLSPMTSFKMEMGIPFDVELQNAHVIDRNQVWIGVVGSGPDGAMLSSAYERRFDPKYLQSLGNAVVNYARVVPHGLLLFYPSYPVMERCLESWTTSAGIWNRIEQHKPIFIEPKRKSDFTVAMDAFYEQVHDQTKNGAVFAAVCRGKVSEGLDFSDANGRAVVIVGLPYPPMMDPRVQLKMQWLDEKARTRSHALSGREWYKQQASRAVNQAIGRVIRHKNDYGAIILCDKRFDAPAALNQLPKWVQPSVKVHANFGAALKDLIVFFKEAELRHPTASAAQPKRRITSSVPGCVGAHFESAQSSRIKVGKLPKSNAFVAHAPSLSGSEASSERDVMKELQRQYAGKSKSASQANRKPTSIIDALDSHEQKTNSEQARLGSTAGFESTSSASRSSNHAGATAGRAKRKLVVREPKAKVATAEQYVAEIKRSVSGESYTRFSRALLAYKTDKDFDAVLTCLTDVLAATPHTYHLFRKFHSFIDSQHKQRFQGACVRVTGKGCEGEVELQTSATKKRRPEEDVGVGVENAAKKAASEERVSLQGGDKTETSEQQRTKSEARHSTPLHRTSEIGEQTTVTRAESTSSDVRGDAVTDNGGAVECLHCHLADRNCLQAKCAHACCVKCWRQARKTDSRCPVCGAQVDKKDFRIARKAVVTGAQ